MNTRCINAPVIARSSSIRLGTALRVRARAGVERTAAKYIGRLNAATVYFSREGRGYRCTVNIDMGAVRIITGESMGFCCHAILDAAMCKAAKQMRRLKRTLRDGKPSRSGRMSGAAPARRDSRAGRRTHRPHQAGSFPQAAVLALWGSHGSNPDAWEETGRWCDEPAHGAFLRSPGRADATLNAADTIEAVLREAGEADSVGGEWRIPRVREAQAMTVKRCP